MRLALRLLERHGVVTRDARRRGGRPGRLLGRLPDPARDGGPRSRPPRLLRRGPRWRPVRAARRPWTGYARSGPRRARTGTRAPRRRGARRHGPGQPVRRRAAVATATRGWRHVSADRGCLRGPRRWRAGALPRAQRSGDPHVPGVHRPDDGPRGAPGARPPGARRVAPSGPPRAHRRRARAHVSRITVWCSTRASSAPIGASCR